MPSSQVVQVRDAPRSVDTMDERVVEPHCAITDHVRGRQVGVMQVTTQVRLGIPIEEPIDRCILPRLVLPPRRAECDRTARSSVEAVRLVEVPRQQPRRCSSQPLQRSLQVDHLDVRYEALITGLGSMPTAIGDVAGSQLEFTHPRSCKVPFETQPKGTLEFDKWVSRGDERPMALLPRTRSRLGWIRDSMARPAEPVDEVPSEGYLLKEENICSNLLDGSKDAVHTLRADAGSTSQVPAQDAHAASPLSGRLLPPLPTPRTRSQPSCRSQPSGATCAADGS